MFSLIRYSVLLLMRILIFYEVLLYECSYPESHIHQVDQ